MQFSTILSLVYLGAGTAVLAAGVPTILARGAIPYCSSSAFCSSTEACESKCGGAAKTTGCGSKCVCVCADGSQHS
ncbi:hypothetical protein PpBr36_02196 [Pyricularia pennisetigena]|uniref:hypothetical protein n=1 Tax=Pyricularia pennisetigena TaxID=1578925 RepID=UPI0011503D78|nr:hypothetical protein PpBr36_02196 [Pyricularia pennisetigena]TLS31126.1 hypothetical protein PpBr36_02196 [Pyricularia pennisetigena]